MPDQPLAIKGIQCVVAPHVNPDQKHLLIDDAFDLEEIKTLYPGAILWTPALSRFYFAFVDPVEYFAMLRERIVFLGEDSFLEELHISEELLRETVCQYATHMLTYPYRKESTTLSDSEFEHVLYGWYLRTLRYFEDGRLDYDYRTLRDYFGSRFSHRPSRFSLLHSIATELAAHLSDDPPVALSNSFQRTA
jgi:hypothetical protein